MIIYARPGALSMRALTQPLTAKNLHGRVWLAAGARDGDRREMMAEAVRRLASGGVDIVRVSSLYETEPVDLPGDRSLLNGAIEASTVLAPPALLAVCLLVEESLEGGFEARALNHSIFTQSETIEGLRETVRDAVRCHFDDDKVPRIIRLHFVREEVITA